MSFQRIEMCLGVFILFSAVMVSAVPVQVVSATTKQPNGLFDGLHRFIAQVKKSSWELIHSLSETPRPDWAHHLDEDPEFVKAHPQEAARIRERYHPSTLPWTDEIASTTTDLPVTTPAAVSTPAVEEEEEASTVQDTPLTDAAGNVFDTNTTAQESDLISQGSDTTEPDTTSTNEMDTLAPEPTLPTEQLEDERGQKLNGTDEDMKEQDNPPNNNEGLDHEKDYDREDAEAHEEGSPAPDNERPNEQDDDVSDKKKESGDELKEKYNALHKAGRKKHKGMPHNP